ncbi:MAG: YHS domain-containing protein, partial [Thermoplasmata archaeon]
MAIDPVCGMFVDERTADLRLVRANRTYYFCSSTCMETFDHPERHARALRRRIALGVPVTIAILGLTYGWRPTGGVWVAAGLATLVQLYLGGPVYQGFWDAVRNRMGNMDVLIAVGTTAAFAYSWAVLLLPGRLTPTTYFDASSAILTLILVGNYLEVRARSRASEALRALHDLLPERAHLLEDGVEDDVPVTAVPVGARFRVRAGERIPVDG